MVKSYLTIFSFQKLLLGCCSVFLCALGVQAQNKYWMQRAGSAMPDEGYSISLDDSNNTYTTGYFSGTAGFGPFSLSTLAISDIFVTKTDSNGIFKWAVKAGDGGSDRGLAIKTDAHGNSYITGYYYGTATFGTYTVTSAGDQDIFVAKYDRNGKIKWVVSAGGTEADIGNAITLDNTGNVLITGQFTGTANFGSFVLTSTNNNINVFTAKLDSSNGTFLWAKSGTGPHTDRGLGVACDPNGNVYITGQFTDTITFDFTSYSPLYEAIFVVKYNSAGVEQWFTMAGGATYNIANAIAVDNNSNVYITGNFQGVLTFFEHTFITLTNIYPNRIFLAKYDQNGNLLWDVADGSNNAVTSNNISLDGSGNAYIVGDFECIMNGYADHYGQGTFNTVGDWDIFTSEYLSTTGAWQWSRQIGGHGNNYGFGIAVTSNAEIFTAGSFDNDMIVPMDNKFLGCNINYQYCPFNDYCNTTYCSDNYYGWFGDFYTVGNLDIFIAKPFDLTRQTYDYYKRTGAICNRPQEGVCIGSTSGICLDTVQFCLSGTISVLTNTCNAISPDYTYLWSTRSTSISINVTRTEWYYVTQTSADGCFTSKDSIYVIIHPDPPQPCISDNVVINTNSTNPRPIKLCQDSVILTGGCFATSDSYYWYSTNPSAIFRTNPITVHAADSSDFCFTITDSNGCSNETCVLVVLDSTEHPIKPELKCITCRHDSAFLCIGNCFTMFAYDSISNPNANLYLCIPPSISTILKWYATPITISYSPTTDCNSADDKDCFTPTDSGWYKIKVAVIRNNRCGNDTNYAYDSVFVRLYPDTSVTLSVRGNTTLCAGDSEWIVATGSSNFTWSNGSTKDSIYVGVGYYYVTASVTTSHGCNARATAYIYITAATIPTPNVTMLPTNGIVCPNDSVRLKCGGGTFQNYKWYGPSGILPGDTDVIYVKNPGNYYCYVTDTLPCPLSRLSNTVLVELYATPFLAISPSPIICYGDSVKLSVIASNGASIHWLPPLSGSDSVKYVKATGTYSCEVISCGITTIVSASITVGIPNDTINVSSPYLCPTGDTVILSADTGSIIYTWNPGNINAQSIIVTQPGTYSLTVVDIYGCTASSSVTIKLATQVADSATSISNVLCYGQNNGSATIHISGGKPTYTYSWSTGATTSSISGLSAGIYTVTLQDKCGSTTTAAVNITQPALLTDSIITLTNVNCFGSNTGGITIGVNGGTSAYTYSWSNGKTTSSITGLSAGTYSITVSDKNGCTTSATALITQPTELATSDISSSNVLCNGGNTGSASLTVSGGTPSYTYSWNPGGQTSSNVTGLSAGSYTVTIKDSLGCSLTSSVYITQPLAITATITPNPATCLNNDGSATLTTSGGTSPYTYLWSPGGNTNSSATGLSTGTYKVTITDANGCLDTLSSALGFTNTMSITVSGSDSICKGKNAVLIASGATSYLWSNGATTSSLTISPNTSSTYWVKGTEGPCTDSVPVNLYVYQTLESFGSPNDTICRGKSVNIKAYAAEGKKAYSYSWNNGITNDSPGPFTVSPDSSTIYIVNVSDACGTMLTDSIKVDVVPPGNVSFYTNPNTIQAGEVINFINTSTGTNSYYWTFGDGGSSTATDPKYTYTVMGNYQIILIGYNARGCPDTAVKDIDVIPNVIIPDVFTPNGDGINDVFYFTIGGATCLHCNIYNRWGVLVYELNSVPEGWPGIIRQTGLPASDGVYYYIGDYCDGNNVQHKLDGFIQLIRDK